MPHLPPFSTEAKLCVGMALCQPTLGKNWQSPPERLHAASSLYLQPAAVNSHPATAGKPGPRPSPKPAGPWICRPSPGLSEPPGNTHACHHHDTTPLCFCPIDFLCESICLWPGKAYAVGIYFAECVVMEDNCGHVLLAGQESAGAVAQRAAPGQSWSLNPHCQPEPASLTLRQTALHPICQGKNLHPTFMLGLERMVLV